MDRPTPLIQVASQDGQLVHEIPADGEKIDFGELFNCCVCEKNKQKSLLLLFVACDLHNDDCKRVTQSCAITYGLKKKRALGIIMRRAGRHTRDLCSR